MFFMLTMSLYSCFSSSHVLCSLLPQPIISFIWSTCFVPISSLCYLLCLAHIYSAVLFTPCGNFTLTDHMHVLTCLPDLPLLPAYIFPLTKLFATHHATLFIAYLHFGVHSGHHILTSAS
ncbi:hypothetical protein XENOCAPTIV_022372 [Xenoophorus captivus]|uniref:Uncharacterized protein n=1 Tax=Xenoophorus captivus TaxID=1517983 RepID=A0ABV0QE33_9TELE